MYFQITTRCNMACAHCCFACRPGYGKDMSHEVFVAGLELAVRSGEWICIGGGEPTIHPHFWAFLRKAVEYNEKANYPELKVWLATNGRRKRDALRLARMTKNGEILAVLSRDQFHAPIDPAVVEAFEELKNHRKLDGYSYQRFSPFEGIRTNTRITPHGSALVNKVYTEKEDCCCGDLLIYPDGKIFACGCRKVRFGTVHCPEIPEEFERGECGASWLKQQEKMRAADECVSTT